MRALIDSDVLPCMDLIPTFLKVTNGSNYLLYCDGTLYSGISGKVLGGYVGLNGYLYYTLWDKKRYYAHRLVAQHFCSGYDEDKQVNHKDADRLNNHYTNLEWVTCAENNLHAHTIKSRNKVASYRHPNTTLSDEDILTIYKADSSNAELARVYGVHPSTIGNIKNGVRHSWLTESEV